MRFGGLRLVWPGMPGVERFMAVAGLRRLSATACPGACLPGRGDAIPLRSCEFAVPRRRVRGACRGRALSVMDFRTLAVLLLAFPWLGSAHAVITNSCVLALTGLGRTLGRRSAGRQHRPGQAGA